MTTWARLAVNTLRNPKISRLSDRGVRDYIGGILYASEFLTDGRLPVVYLDTVPRRSLTELVASGLWIRQTDGSIVVHDFLAHQNSKDQVARIREQNRERQTRHRHAVTHAVTHTVTHAVTNAKVTRPDKEKDLNTPPLTPPPSGGARIRREHRKKADAIFKSWLGYCRHTPDPCPNSNTCYERILRELAAKGRAS
jgi:hypothetical protein